MSKTKTVKDDIVREPIIEDTKAEVKEAVREPIKAETKINTPAPTVKKISGGPCI